MNLTKETEEPTEAEILAFLRPYGKVSIIKSIKDYQNKKIAKNGYFIALYQNSSVEDDKFIKFCIKTNTIIQFDLFND